MPNYDYSQPGGYFITVVTYQRALLFGKIVNQEMQLNEFGKVADECWRSIPEHFPNVELGAYVIMPNHVHGIIMINESGTTMNSSSSVGARHASPLPHGVKPRSIGAIIGSFKSAVTRNIRHQFHTSIWERNYYEHILRNERDLHNKTAYFEANPMLCADDGENPINVKA